MKFTWKPWLRKLALSLMASGLAFPTAGLAADLGTNLVTNPSFEMSIPGSVSSYSSQGTVGWATAPLPPNPNDATAYRYAQNYAGTPAPPGGGDFHYTGGFQTVPGAVRISQNVDVSGIGAIGSGTATYSADAFFSSYRGQGETSTIRFRFLDAASNELATDEIAPVLGAPSDNGSPEWTQNSISGTVDPNTASIAVEVISNGGATNYDGYVDLINLQIDGGANLVVNGNFEDTNSFAGPFGSAGINAWEITEIPGQPAFTYSFTENPPSAEPYTADPPEGFGERYYAGFSSPVFQTLDVSEGDTAAAIAAGEATYDLSAFFSSYFSQGDFSTLTARFLDESGQVLGEASIGSEEFVANIPTDPDGRKFWEQDATGGVIPIGTAQIELELDATGLSGGFEDGYVDLVNFQVNGPAGVIPEPGSLVLFVLPAAALSLAGRRRNR